MSLSYSFNTTIFTENRDLVAALQPQTNCARTALTLIVSDCGKLSSFNEDQQLRVSLAVGLAVCEFKAAQVTYPDACNNIEDWMSTSACTQQLVSSPQWWTTYHGCYNSVKQICHMHEASRECDRALKTHSQIVDMQEKLHTKMDQYWELVETMSDHRDAVLDYWNDTFDFMSETLAHMKETSVSLNAVYRDNFAQAQEHFQMLSENLQEARVQMENLGWAAQDAVVSLSKSTLAEQSLVSERLKNDASSLHKLLVLAHQDTTESFETQLQQSLTRLVESSDNVLLNHVQQVSSRLSALMSDLEESQKKNMDMQHQLQQKVRTINDDIEGFTDTVKQGLEASHSLLNLVKSKIQLVNGVVSVFSRPVRSAFQLASFIIMIRAAFIGGIYTSIGLVMGSMLGVLVMQQV
ncbi:nuclear fusion protein KAR5 [Yarrowia lipolytica]|uniref:Nuclear fusion protein KAR5 n=1 Tax=Yarrowia lipolytica TaxID=4952 RepID=A0A371C4D6_YARLL|nr:Nuclear fusion protein KAR5 [Yarrowia lipolytica]RDW25184.1 nuclear fusion protein KAR5 [Yarrowia lipolytica]RDW32205.1 nuclear fusion protein KAR5 [Yarrowia lipolytica]RDW45863.1 nuclear fusion protein KAR5 [Yarrowia lipolytica]RDW52407.1 nuclear fusion protein KAR5 [Yarrowia lipolytica]